MYKLQKLYRMFLLSSDKRDADFTQSQPFKDFIRRQAKK